MKINKDTKKIIIKHVNNKNIKAISKIIILHNIDLNDIRYICEKDIELKINTIEMSNLLIAIGSYMIKKYIHSMY